MILNIVKNIKVIHPEHILFVKIGNFYHVYGKDSYIISYLFGYKLIMLEDNISTCGFSIYSFNKVISLLEQKKINYLAVDRRNNYETDLIQEFGNLNEYGKIYNNSKKYISYKRRIDNINNFLINNIKNDDFIEILKKMENVINETRKF